MKLRIAIIFFIIFILGAFGVVYLKDYFFLQSPGVSTKKQNLSALEVVAALSDESIELSDYRGKKLSQNRLNEHTHKQDVVRIFHFWASWCDPCAMELPELIAFSKKIQAGRKNRSDASEVQIYLISLDSDFEGLSKFIKIFPEIVSDLFIQVWDRNNILSSRYGIDKLPMSIFLYANGKVEIRDGVVDWKNVPL